MFDKTTCNAVVQNRIGCIGYSLSSPNRFIYSGNDNIYLQTDLKYKIFTDVFTLKYIRNVAPRYRTPVMLSFDAKLHAGSFVGYTNTYVNSGLPMIAAFGQKFTSTTNHVYVDFGTKTVKTSSEIFYSAPVNYNAPLYIENQTYGVKTGFFYCTNAMFETTFNPSFETICYPSRFDLRMSSLYSSFENLSKDYVDVSLVIPASFGISNTVRMYRPKFLFQPGRLGGTTTWYSYNKQTSEFVIQTPNNGLYFTFDELRTKGNTFKEYLAIPRQSLVDLYNGPWTVLVNNFLLPIYVSHKYWTDGFDIYQFLWVQNVSNKYMFVLGSI